MIAERESAIGVPNVSARWSSNAEEVLTRREKSDEAQHPDQTVVN